MGKLDDRIVLVTGASRGIGLAIARACGREGARIVAVARHRPPLERAASLISGAAAIMTADVTSPVSVERLFREVRRKFRRLDALVNNAGVFTYKTLEKTSLEDWQLNIATNLTSLFLTTRAALPLLAHGRSPQIVNILSISSLKAFPKNAAYTASKFGALGFTRVLSEELRPRGIRVTAVFPGSTNTRMSEKFDFPVVRSRLLAPEDIGEAVLGALTMPARAVAEDVVVLPARGSL